MPDHKKYVLTWVLKLGQEFARLLPPATDTKNAGVITLSPNGHLLLTIGSDHVARLQDIRTGHSVVLQQSDETVIHAGWSPDGQTVFTDAWDGSVRFWDAPSGRLRAATPPRIDRYEIRCPRGVLTYYGGLPDQPSVTGYLCQVTNTRLLTAAVESVELRKRNVRPSAADLWDTTTGRQIARFNCQNGHWNLILGTRRIVHIDTEKANVVARLYDADTGRLLDSLRLPVGSRLKRDDVVFGPSGYQVVLTETSKLPSTPGVRLRLYDVTDGWRELGRSLEFNGDDPPSGEFLSNGLFTCTAGKQAFVVVRTDRGRLEHVLDLPERPTPAPGLLRVRCRDIVYDLATGTQTPKPGGCRFHPALKPGAVEGRIRWVDGQFVDLSVDRELPSNLMAEYSPHVPGLGLVGSLYAGDMRVLPTTPPAISPAELELWVKVAVCGDLRPDGQFVRWDEATWDANHHRLAAIPPTGEFPFPGHLASDSLHWLKGEYHRTERGREHIVAEKIVRRAEQIGDRATADDWRRILPSQTTVAIPAPRPKP
jgi:hypothetical protein